MPTINATFLPDLGLWKVTQASQTCVAWRFGHDKLEGILGNPQAKKDLGTRGVYVLCDDSSPKKRIAYVGEAENLAKRLKQHAAETFWSFGIAVFASNGFLEKSHIKFLEHVFWNAIRSAGTYRLENKAEPTKPFVSDSDSLEDFFEMVRLFAVPLGVPYLFADITSLQPPSPPPPIPASRRFSAAGILSVSVMELERRGKLTDMDVSFLASGNAQRKLKAGYGGFPAIKKDSRQSSDFVSNGINRYQRPDKALLVHKGVRYRITNEVHDASDGSTPVYDWALSRGLTDSEIAELCRRHGVHSRRKKA